MSAPMTLFDLCCHADDRPALALADGGTLRLSAFAARVAGLTGLLAQRPEQRWLLAAEDLLPGAIGLFALLHAGKRVVLPRNFQPAALAETAATCDATLDTAQILASASRNPADLRAIASTASIELTTSGSSGAPKGIAKRLAQLDAEVAALDALWGDSLAGCATIASVPWHHIYGLLFRLLWPLSAGRVSDTVLCATPHDLLARAQTLGRVSMVSSPAHLARMAGLLDPAAFAPHAASVFSSGAPLGAATAAVLGAALGSAPVEVYGSSESGGIAWRRQWPDADVPWQPLPGVQVRCDDDGLLHVLSPWSGIDTALPVGDRGAACAGGFRLLGRIDRIAKIEGKRVSLSEIEARLVAHPWVAEAITVGLSGTRDHIGAVLVPSEAGRLALAESGRATLTQTLKTHLRTWFDAVLLPRRWRIVATLPHDERGKLSQAALTALFETRDGG